MNRKFLHQCCDVLWDLWCAISIVGIWPRWIEPRLLFTTFLGVKLDPRLKGMKIALFSDLHLNSKTPEVLLKKIAQKTREFNPDIIFFAGDFLCYSRVQCQERFHQFFNDFAAPLGCYAALGNHDYDQCAGLNANGEYDLLPEKKQSFIISGLKRMFMPIVPLGVHAERLSQISTHDELESLLKNTPFKLLQNETVSCCYQGVNFNVTGVGEYSLNQCKPAIAFKDFDEKSKGIVLAHNPDAFKLLKGFPGSLIFSGHTHGGQVNLPWVWRKLTVMEDCRWKSGLVEEGDKSVYVTRGIGSVFSFRWFSPPELVLVTVEA